MRHSEGLDDHMCSGPCSSVLPRPLLQHNNTPLHPLPHGHLSGGVWAELLRRLPRKHLHGFWWLHQHYAVQKYECTRWSILIGRINRKSWRNSVASQTDSAGASWVTSLATSSPPTIPGTTRPTWSARGPSIRRPNVGFLLWCRKSSCQLRTSVETT